MSDRAYIMDRYRASGALDRDQEHVVFLRDSRISEDPEARTDFERCDGGSPLGVGMPSGGTLRLDGETHREAWMRIIRFDPCSYCSRSPGGTLDHVEPMSRRARGIGGLHSWLNYAGACGS